MTFEKFLDRLDEDAEKRVPRLDEVVVEKIIADLINDGDKANISLPEKTRNINTIKGYPGGLTFDPGKWKDPIEIDASDAYNRIVAELAKHPEISIDYQGALIPLLNKLASFNTTKKGQIEISGKIAK